MPLTLPTAKFYGKSRLDRAQRCVITYAIDGIQRVAFVAGTNSPIWPVEKKTAKMMVFALGKLGDAYEVASARLWANRPGERE